MMCVLLSSKRTHREKAMYRQVTAEKGVMLPKAKSQGMPGTARSGRSKEGFFPGNFRGSMVLLITLILDS